MSKRNKIIAVVAGVVVLGIVGFLLFSGQSTPSGSAISADGTSAGPTTEAEQNFINLTAELNPISFDTSIFSDPRFTTLVDLHTVIVPEPVGRTDPFAPI